MLLWVGVTPAGGEVGKAARAAGQSVHRLAPPSIPCTVPNVPLLQPCSSAMFLSLTMSPRHTA